MNSSTTIEETSSQCAVSEEKDAVSANERKRRYSQTQVVTLAKTENENGQEQQQLMVQRENGRIHSPDAKKYREDIENNDCFSLELFSDEVLYEIFKHLDTWSLMTLMNVSDRFQKFVLDKRFWINIDLSQEPLPLGILEDMLDRSHIKTKHIRLRGPSPSEHIEGEITHFNKTIKNALNTRCTQLLTLELNGITLDFTKLSIKDFPTTIKRLVLDNCHVRVDSNKSLFAGVESVLINLIELAIENNSWFDPYYVMPISKLPLLNYLSLRGCKHMHEFIPYGSIAARHGFKQLEVLDLRDTPLNDSDLQCFNSVETLREIYLEHPEIGKPESEGQGFPCSPITHVKFLSNRKETESPPLPSAAVPQNTVNSNSSAADDLSIVEPLPANLENQPSTSSSALTLKQTNNAVSKSEMEPSTSTAAAAAAAGAINTTKPWNNFSAYIINNGNAEQNSTNSNENGNILPIVGTNAPAHCRFLPRPDHIIYLDVRNRTSPVHINLRDRNTMGQLRQVAAAAQQLLPTAAAQAEQLSPPPFQQMLRHNLFWDIINPLGRVAAGAADRLHEEESNYVFNLPNQARQPLQANPSRTGTISDRGVCCFGRTRQPVQQGVIWIRFNNRPRENRLERFSVRHYKYVTDVSLHHLVQCSPHLAFLDVSGTSVTPEGVQMFKALKPECEIVAAHLLDQSLWSSPPHMPFK